MNGMRNETTNMAELNNNTFDRKVLQAALPELRM
jgi:hypothetical protein